MKKDAEKEPLISPDALRGYWERKAKRYPLPFDKGMQEKAVKLISRVKDMGVRLEGKRVLEIGCGTGVITAALAREALSVTGIDISQVMIESLKNEMLNRDIGNISTLRAAWKECDPAALGFEKTFDSVWTVISTAVNDAGDMEKMERCAVSWCVYAGAKTVCRAPLMEEILSKHHMATSPFTDAGSFYAMLKDRGRCPQMTEIDLVWDWKESADNIFEDLVDQITTFGSTPDMDFIRSVLQKHTSGDGTIRYTNRMIEGIIVWKAPG